MTCPGCHGTGSRRIRDWQVVRCDECGGTGERICDHEGCREPATVAGQYPYAWCAAHQEVAA